MVSTDDSDPPQLLEMYLAPSVVAAVSSATYSPVPESLLASTRLILQFGQIAETMSMSRDSSSVQSSPAGAAAGSGEVSPFWLYWVNWPDVRAGRPAADRYAARSLAAVGSL